MLFLDDLKLIDFVPKIIFCGEKFIHHQSFSLILSCRNDKFYFILFKRKNLIQ